jgi:hypothetical protein
VVGDDGYGDGDNSDREGVLHFEERKKDKKKGDGKSKKKG